MAGFLDSWTGGSPSAHDQDHPGERFGLPAEGVGAVAGFGRRLVGVTVDWLLAYVLTLAVMGLDALGGTSIGWWVWVVWFVLTVIPTALFGMTPGMVAVGIRVARVDMAATVGFRAILRTVLLGVVLPALIRDADGRGWHDRATQTIVVRSRA
ncbi:RDD family protein [Pseudonocardia sp. RS11V-5]|uniref:RDD family protein n=1 Tax=Pseudonocardia terrae TaxID=2905831 RepID=UPI001E524031|nr:RDD family protein [Pseudonocardia terrae]MCE3551914.1 RDD family protein [Pseudonocardia terrae]